VPAALPSPKTSDPSIRARLRLQQRAPDNLREHLRRLVVRVTVLVSSDLLSFFAMRGLVRAVRDHAVLGGAVADTVHSALPPGILNGWQYATALVLGLALTGNYGQGDDRRNPRQLLIGCALATALPLWMTIWTRGVGPVLLQYSITTTLVWLGLLVERLSVDRIAARVRPQGGGGLETLFVGPGDDCRSALEGAAFAAGGDYRPIGFVDTDPEPAEGAIGHVAEFPLLLAATGAQVVVLCGMLGEDQFTAVVETALMAGCQVLSVPRAVKVAGVPTVVWRRGQPLVELTAPSLKGWQLALKRGVDVCGALVGMVLLAPLFALLALLVKLDSPGPVFFRQERVGRGGRRFRIYKFRTMVDGAEARRDELLGQSVYSDARLFKVPRDPRTTKLGRWLRRTSLDELPQLMNVLAGEMSLVGPRPPLPSEVILYEAHHYARFDVKPGMTGPWQVAGRNGITDFERVVALETEYIRGWSLLGDCEILLRTVWVVLGMRGAH
jgi:exopolysaccharide biosynthesis polyprenyl glycosylphosphotransferase